MVGFWACLLLLAGCPDKKPKYPLCDSDKDCKDGQFCVNKTCVQCKEDANCPDGESCESGACVAKKDACTSDDMCEQGQVCQDGACRACESNGECGPGGTCNAGVCARPKACNVDEDCEDDEDCLDGRCQRPWQGDAPDALTCQLDPVYFGFDEAVIPETERAALDQNAECILEAPADRDVSLVGHTDDTGTEEYNIALSERRAQAVQQYLERLGIDLQRMGIVPMGESQPTGQGPDKDRRVEFQWR